MYFDVIGENVFCTKIVNTYIRYIRHVLQYIINL